MSRTIRYDHAEEAKVREVADQLNIFPNAFIRAAIRYALGLPIPSRIERAIQGSRPPQ